MYGYIYNQYLEIINTNKGIKCILRKELSNAYFKICKGGTCKYIIIDNKIIFYKYVKYLGRYVVVTIPDIKGTKIEEYTVS